MTPAVLPAVLPPTGGAPGTGMNSLLAEIALLAGALSLAAGGGLLTLSRRRSQED